MITVGLVAILLFADAEAAPPAGTPPAPAPAAPAPSADTTPAPSPAPAADQMAPPPLPPPAPEPEPEPPRLRPRRYGDQGMPEIGLGLGYSNAVGFIGAGAFRYFVIDGVAPGIEMTYVSGGNHGEQTGLLLAALRLVPVRTGSFALLLTGRGGRVLLGNHDDGWGVGGSAGVLILFAPTAGIELGYEVLRLTPASFCADLTSCYIQGPVVGFRFGF
jgi:hypothetical protein